MKWIVSKFYLHKDGRDCLMKKTQISLARQISTRFIHVFLKLMQGV